MAEQQGIDLLTPIAEVPATSEGEQPAAPAPVEGQEQEQETTAESKPQPTPDQEAKKALRGVQKRIDELTRDKHQAIEQGQQQAEYWRQQAFAAAQELERQKQATQAPRFEQFNGNMDEYTAAVARHEAEKIAATRIAQERQFFAAQQQQAQQQAAKQQAEARYAQAVEAKISEAVKKYPDFVEVVTSPELPGLRDTPAFSAILDSEKGAEVMYYLGKNPLRAHQIAALSPIGQVREIGRIEAMLANGKATSGAPAPVPTVSGNASNVRRSIADPSLPYNEYVKMRRDARRKQ